MVEYAYAACFGTVIRRITDQSLEMAHPERVRYAASKMLPGDEGDYRNGAPQNRRWRKISEKEAQKYMEGEY